MGREIKRVPILWDWPLDKVWEGFLNPLGGFPPCPDCSYKSAPTIMDQLFPSAVHGTGLTPEAYAIDQTFYPHQIESAMFGGSAEGARRLAWGDKLGQAEVDNLVAEGRLSTWVDGKWKSLPRVAAEVNAENRRGGIGGHDAINRWILLDFRCKVLGIERKCATCKGEGDIATDAERDAYENWAGTEPPTGEGWQVWETVSEGSPITPAFATADELVDYLATYGTTWDQSTKHGPAKGPWRREAAESFVKAGWAPTFMTGPGIDGLAEGGRDADVIEASHSS